MRIRSLLYLGLCVASAAAPARAEDDTWVALEVSGSRGEVVDWAEFEVSCPLTGRTQKGGPKDRYGPFPPGVTIEVALRRAVSRDGWRARDQGWTRSWIDPGLVTIPARIDFAWWDFAVESIEPVYAEGPARPGDAQTLDDWEEMELSFTGHTVLFAQWGWSFPQRSPWIPRSQKSAPFHVVVRYPDGRVGKASYRVHRAEPRLQAVVPVQRPSAEQAREAPWDLHVVILSSDLCHRARDMELVLVTLDGEEVFSGKAPANTIAVSNIPAGEAAFVIAGGILPDGRQASRQATLRYDPEADVDRDFTYTWVAVLEFGEAPADAPAAPVGGRDAEQRRGAGAEAEDGPSWDGLERRDGGAGGEEASGGAGRSRGGDEDESDGSSAQGDGGAGDPERIILTGHEPDGRGGVDPAHVVIVVQFPNGETEIRDGAEAIATLRRRGFLVPGTHRLTASGRRGWETPWVDPSIERPVRTAELDDEGQPPDAPPPAAITSEREVSWVFAIRYAVSLPDRPDREGTAIEVHVGSGTQPEGVSGSAVARAEAAGDLRSWMAAYLPPGEKVWTDGLFLTDEGERLLSGYVNGFTIEVLDGPFEDSSEAREARRACIERLKGRGSRDSSPRRSIR